MTVRNSAELAAGELEKNNYELLTPDIDPLQLAVDAVQKLRDAGLPTYIPAAQQLHEPVTDNVAYIEDFRNLKNEPDTGLVAEETEVVGENSRDRHLGELAPGDKRGDGDPLRKKEQPSLTPEQQQKVAEHQHRVKRLAGKMARKWGARGHEHDEVLSDAYLGLVKAAVNYDRRKRHSAATTDSEYFTKSINGEMLKGFRTRYGRVHITVKNKEGRTIGEKEKISKVNPSVMSGMATADSLEAPLKEDGDATLAEVIASPGSGEEDIIDQVSVREELSSLLENCTPIEKEIMLRRVVLGQTQAEIGRAVGYGQMHISRIITRVAGHLRPKKPSTESS